MKIEQIDSPLKYDRQESIIPPYRDYKWDLVYLRNIRNSYLDLTDKFVLPDYQISPENLEIIKTYRQQLRDIININSSNILNGIPIEIPKPPF
jgi:hypothetical protein